MLCQNCREASRTELYSSPLNYFYHIQHLHPDYVNGVSGRERLWAVHGPFNLLTVFVYAKVYLLEVNKYYVLEKMINVTQSINRNRNRKHLTEACDIFNPVEKSSFIGL